MVRNKVLGVLVGLVLLATGAYAQRLYVGPSTPENPRWVQKGDFDGSIIFCRGFYNTSSPDPEIAGWWTDTPGADQNFLVRLAELTEVRVRFDPDRIPFYKVVRLDDPMLFKCPILFLEDVGGIQLTEGEIHNLQHFFDQGGFLWVDDFWGSAAWEHWDVQIRQVLPSGLYPIVDIPNDHPIFSMLYDVRGGIWQQPNIGFWSNGCGYGSDDGPGVECHSTSERGEDSIIPNFRGILDDHDRLIVVTTHNTDIADGWEEEKPQNQEYLDEFSARSYALGIDIFLYGLTH